ncbi:AUR protein kinase [Aphanomyces astaci]|uniref:AUR protein kinase n=1 Tax=Aphanomyces astaci TaxID=112090 RepID=W4GW08_APHAT|nr:AUR protein kinase [Aphanomyces astaci]ETV83078.1 AUR protein kinase [Aphanomyces astaci]|eukprot:XP_009827749.1 AUR protein kinase [Aphanomyces astaci]
MDMQAKLEEWKEKKRKRDENSSSKKNIATGGPLAKKGQVAAGHGSTSKLRAPSTLKTVPTLKHAHASKPLVVSNASNGRIVAAKRTSSLGTLARSTPRVAVAPARSGRINARMLNPSTKAPPPSAFSSHDESKDASISSDASNVASEASSTSPTNTTQTSDRASSYTGSASLEHTHDAPRRILNKKRLSHGEAHWESDIATAIEASTSKLTSRSSSLPTLAVHHSTHSSLTKRRLSNEAMLDALAKHDSPTRVLRRVSLDAPSSVVTKPTEDRRASYEVTPSKRRSSLTSGNGGGALRVLANKPPDSSDDEDDDVLSSSIPEDRELPQHHARGQLRRKSSSSRLSVSRAPFRTSLDPSVEEQNHDKSRAKFTLDDFKYTDKKLGFGKFGYVYLAKQRTAAETEVALKVLTKSNMDEVGIRSLKMEVEIQSRLKHPHILRLYRYFHEDSLAYLVLEYAPHGSLQRLLSDQPRGYFAEAVAVAFVHQVVRAVQYLHARHVIHRDIKPENLLLGTLDTIKVADFGLAIHAPPPNRKRRHFCGTPEYMSPEIVDHQEYSVEVDVWSVGIVAYELLVGHTPFRGDNVFHNIQTWYTHKLQNPDMAVPGLDECDHVSPMAKQFVHGLLAPAATRWSLDQAMQHPWLAGGAIKHLPVPRVDA